MTLKFVTADTDHWDHVPTLPGLLLGFHCIFLPWFFIHSSTTGAVRLQEMLFLVDSSHYSGKNKASKLQMLINRSYLFRNILASKMSLCKKIWDRVWNSGEKSVKGLGQRSFLMNQGKGSCFSYPNEAQAVCLDSRPHEIVKDSAPRSRKTLY